MLRKYITEAQKNKTEYSLGSTQIIILEQPNIDFGEVVQQLQRYIPRYLLSLIDTVYIGRFEELTIKAVDSAYMDGAIYMLPDQTSVEDAFEDIVHEIAHAFEEAHRQDVYEDQKIAKEFVYKRMALKALLDNPPDCDFRNIDYDLELDDYLFTEVGYPLLQKITMGLFLDPYSITSLREYFATAFEGYFLHKNRKEIKELCPAIYEKLENIEEIIL